MTAAVLLGMAAGVGLWALLVAWKPPRKPLAEALADLHRTGAPAPPGHVHARWRAGRPLGAVLERWGLPRPGMRADLRLLGKPADVHLAQQATLGVVGALTPVAFAGAAAAAGIGTGGPAAPIWVALLLAAGGYLLPDIRARRAAAAVRSDARHALAGFVDLVSISLAGGAGVHQALADAADTAGGQLTGRIRRVLTQARITRTDPWLRLRELGVEMSIPELEQMAATASLAAGEGARVRASLAARAAALRTRQLANAEADAAAATERLSVPVVLLFAAFLLLLSYPAVWHVTVGGL